MKEFIEKLIGRLKEKLLEYINKANDEMIENGHTLDFENFLGHKEAYETVLYEIVNELAEEYKNDFCEWKMFKANARLRHKNCMFAEDTVDPWKFNFCPYCGKKIKVVE